MKRNLSGIYFREKQPDWTFDNVCFEDLGEAKQDEILSTKNVDFIKGLAKSLGKTIKRIGDQFDIMSE